MQLSLNTPSGEILIGLPQIAAALFEAAGKSNDALGASAEDKAEVDSWLARIGNGDFVGDDKLKVSHLERGIGGGFCPAATGPMRESVDCGLELDVLGDVLLMIDLLTV